MRSQKNEKFMSWILFELELWNLGLNSKSERLIFVANYKFTVWIEPNFSLDSLIKKKTHFNDKLQN